jgi:hypothetical protein
MGIELTTIEICQVILMSEYHPHQPISGHERVGFLHGNFTMFATQL